MDYQTKIKIISWNVRGLNEKDKRLAVRHTIITEKPDIVCLQETKLSATTPTIISQTCGRRFKEFAVKDADGTKGGILVAWDPRRLTRLKQTATTYCLTLEMQLEDTGQSITVTGVYGPSVRSNRVGFYEDLATNNPNNNKPWLLCGDFNATLKPEDRNKQPDWRELADFGDTVSKLSLIDIGLNGRQFTWSNARERPALARLDRFLVFAEWSSTFPNSAQHALPNTSSDHCPLLLTACTGFKRSKLFRFENCWLSSDSIKKYGD